MSGPFEGALWKQRARLAWPMALSAIGVSLIAFGLGIYFLLTTGSSRSVGVDDFLIPVPTAAYTLIGGLVATKHPRNLIGWIFIAVGWLYSFDILRDVYQDFGTELGFSGAIPALADNLWIPRILLPTIFVFLIFPEGTHLSRRWAVIFWSAAIALAVQHVALALHPGPVPQVDMGPNPGGIPALAGTLNLVLLITGTFLLIGIVGSIAAFVTRFRRSIGIERQQMKWLGYAISLAVASFVFGTLAWSFWPLLTDLSDFLTEITILGIALATGIAILRHRLFDIDLVINRTILYGTLTLIVVLVYVLLVGGIGALFQTEGSLFASFIATGMVAVIFQPLHERLQRAVNRLTFGDRDEPFEALERLGRRLESVFTPEMVYPTIVETVAQALKIPYAAIATQRGEMLEVVEAHGSSNGEPLSYSLFHQGEVIGQLLVGRRSPDENFTRADDRLLRGFARQAGAAVHAVQLTADLLRSRQRLVTAREEERLRLRRDLHDGLGPTLAAVAWQAESARDMIAAESPEAAQLLENTIRQAQNALGDIRRLVYGLRPPALDELGLAGALEQSARQHQHTITTIEAAEPLPILPAAVEVAAYRIVQEAIKNAIEHGKAGNIQVRLTVEETPEQGVLCLAIRDDGLGLPAVVKPGIGLRSMRERAEELGGAFVIRSLEGKGTKIEVYLPVELDTAHVR